MIEQYRKFVHLLAEDYSNLSIELNWAYTLIKHVERMTKNSIELGVEKEKFQAEKKSKMEADLKLKKTKEEFDAEIESLGNKMNSIKNLTSFVEKKFSSGKLSKKNYDKQTKKLSSDLKKTQDKIDELTQELREM